MNAHTAIHVIARIQSFAFSGIEAVPVEVQVQISAGLPAFLVVGLPDKAVGEARERVRAALSAMGLALPPRRVLVNLAPADLLKEGSHFDLPIALGVLAAMDVLPREELGGYAALGELSLDGTLNAVAGVLPAAMGASRRDLGLICPAAQGGEAAWAGRIDILAPADLLSLINHFRGSQVLTPPEPAGLAVAGTDPDLIDVKGMETAKRALEIAAAGGHNLLMIGSPGAGKSMLAARLSGLLPNLAPAEALEVSMDQGENPSFLIYQHLKLDSGPPFGPSLAHEETREAEPRSGGFRTKRSTALSTTRFGSSARRLQVSLNRSTVRTSSMAIATGAVGSGGASARLGSTGSVVRGHTWLVVLKVIWHPPATLVRSWLVDRLARTRGHPSSGASVADRLASG